MSASNFVCVICDLKTSSLADLQEHTRKHASTDRKTAKCKVSMNSPKLSDSTPCDVCTEVFDTPTKAISHKFKKHPNASNTYFCPWCGKQFPIKHILDKHKLSHNETEPDKIIPCDYCDSMFFQVKAAQYHITYFHKREFMLTNYIQTPPPSLKILFGSNGDVQSAYYCQFCGNEYVLKYNLQQHIKRLHTKENSNLPPEDVIRCKSCNALFYTVEAFEFHLSFHSDKDLYVDNEEKRQRLVSKIDQDFDARRVRLNQDKTRTSYQKNQGQGISDYSEKLFSYIGNMSSLSPPPSDSESEEEEDKDDDKTKVPSENAITIGEFFEMNKEVLGDCMDGRAEDIEIQGQEILSQRKSKKKKKQKAESQPRAEAEKKTEVEEFISSNKLLYKKFKNVKFLDLKVQLERIDLGDVSNKNKSSQLTKVAEKCQSVTSKKLIPVKMVPKNVQPMKLLRNILPGSDLEKNKIAPLSFMNNEEPKLGKIPIEMSKLPKNLIPVSAIPQDAKVKVFKKVLIPKGTLQPGVKILTKKELEDLGKKGVLLPDFAVANNSTALKPAENSHKQLIKDETVPPIKKLKM